MTGPTARDELTTGTVIERGIVPCRQCHEPHDYRVAGPRRTSWAADDGHPYVHMSAEEVVEFLAAARSEAPGDGHVFRHVDPEAKCPICSFPAWTHDPAMAFLNSQELDAETLAEAIYNVAQKQLVPKDEWPNMLKWRDPSIDAGLWDRMAAYAAELAAEHRRLRTES